MPVSMQRITNEIQQQNWVAAEHDLQAGLQEHPNSAKGWYYLAQVEGKLGHIGEAKTALQHADTIDPSHSYAANLQIYNELYSKVNYAQAVNPVPAAPVEHHALVQEPVYHQNVQSGHPGLYVGFGLLALVVIAVYFFKRKKKKEQSYTVTSPAPTASVSPAGLVAARPGYQRPISVPQPYYSAPSPAPSSSSHFVEGMVVGALADEAISAATGRYSKSSSDSSFDYGSSSSSSSSGFDFGSSSSSSDSSWGSDSSSSSSSFDFGSSSSFDTGSSMDSSSW